MEKIEAPGHPKVLSVGLRFDSIKPYILSIYVFDKVISFIKRFIYNLVENETSMMNSL